MIVRRMERVNDGIALHKINLATEEISQLPLNVSEVEEADASGLVEPHQKVEIAIRPQFTARG